MTAKVTQNGWILTPSSHPFFANGTRSEDLNLARGNSESAIRQSVEILDRLI
jgi:hypothetical protein